MAKFYGKVGFAETIEDPPNSSIFVEKFTEYPYYGDLNQDLRKLQTPETLNENIMLQNVLEIMADKYLYEHYFAIRYVRFEGVCWKVGYVEVNRPRLRLRFGEVYNGPTADGP